MREVDLLVRAGHLVAAHDQPAIGNGAVAIAGDTIEAVGTYDEFSARYPGVDAIGADRFLLLPGLVNGHGHGRGLSSFQRGTLDGALETWIFDLRRQLTTRTYDDVAYSAARLLKSGVTTTMHNHILRDPGLYRSEFDAILQAYRDAGMRVLFCPAIRNANPFVYGDNEAFMATLPGRLREFLTKSPPPAALTGDNYVQVVRDLHAQHDGPMTRIGFGPLAPQWCTKELLRTVRREADRLGAPIHIHALESILQKLYARRFAGKTLIAYMNDLGFLGRGLTVGHCVWPTEADIDLLARTQTGVTHHPSSNLRLRVGIAPVFPMLQAGICAGLGLDGQSINDDDDFIQEMKVCFLLHRLAALELDSPHLSARQVLQMATENSATLLNYGHELGRLEPGRKADLVLLDYEEMCRPFVDPSHDPIETLLYRGLGRHVHTVMVGGRLVVQDGRVLTLDEEAIGARLAAEASRPRTEEERQAIRSMDELGGHVLRYYKDWTEGLEVEPFYRVNSRSDG